MITRRGFVSKTCIACLGAGLFPSLLSSCRGTHYVSGILEGNGIAVSKSEFIYHKKDKAFIRKFIVVENDRLEYPVYLYRQTESQYKAMLMRCTHQGTELLASGDHLYCTSHGSEFNNEGQVITGPADDALRSFKVLIEGGQIIIYLS